MNQSRVVPITLLATTVAPVTLFLLPMVLFGSIFWIAGLIDLLAGRYGLEEFQRNARPDMALLFVTAPLGLIGLFSIWVFLLSEIRRKSTPPRRHLIGGLCCGAVALVHMAYIKFLFPLILVPATGYAWYKLRSAADA